MRFRIIGPIVAWMLSSTVWAADPCQSQSNTIEINACAKQRFDEQDKLLNRTYQALLSTISAENPEGVTGESPRVLLVIAQRQWVEFRDADCNAQYQVFAGGTIRNAVFLGCLQQRTEQRIKELSSSQWHGG